MSKTFDTLEELRKAVQHKLGHQLTDKDWQRAKPYWLPPYDYHDQNEIIEKSNLRQVRCK